MGSDQPHLVMCPSLYLSLQLGCDTHVHSQSHMNSEWEMGDSPKKSQGTVPRGRMGDTGDQNQQYPCCSLTSLSQKLSYYINLGCVNPGLEPSRSGYLSVLTPLD